MAYYMAFIALIFGAFVIYQVENEDNEQFSNFGDSLWWSLVTFTTIGYGDKVPNSGIGKIIASIFSVLGISLFALPAGILGTGFALKVQEQHRNCLQITSYASLIRHSGCKAEKRQKHAARRRNPAAYFLQCAWRVHRSEMRTRNQNRKESIDSDWFSIFEHEKLLKVQF